MKAPRLLFLLLCVSWLSMPIAAYAADPVICSASVAGGVAFGSIDPLNPANTDSTANLSYTCASNTTTNYYVTVCFNIAAGPLGASAGNRQLTGPGGNLGFQLYRDSARTQPWGAVNDATFTTPGLANFYLPKNGSQSGSIPIYARFFGGQATATPGAYTTSFAYPNIQITGILQTTSGLGSCGQAGTDAGGFSSFAINATLIKTCVVNATTDLDFGSQAATATNVGASTGSVTVTCSNNTTYTVGLAPNSTGSATGAGNMKGTGSNNDLVPYQLYSNAALTTKWGNTPGSNTLAKTGTGGKLALPIYGKVSSTDYTPDTYKDVVTVNVVY